MYPAPLLPVADASVLAALVDGTVVVAHAGRVRRTQLVEAVGNLERVSARVLGVVLNQVQRDEETYSYRQRRTGKGTGDSPAPTPAGRPAVPVSGRS